MDESNQVAIVSNDLGEFTIYESGGQWYVTGTGMFKPRCFQRGTEATEFAQDQLLILTLENTKAILEN